MSKPMLNELMDEFAENYAYGKYSVSHAQKEMLALIKEEVHELEAEIGKNELAFVKEAIDLIYITAQQLRARGVNIDSALNEVHRSNMSKLLPDALSEEEIEKELELAIKRYPHAYLSIGGSDYNPRIVLRCALTNKIIKPTCYSITKLTKEEHLCG